MWENVWEGGEGCEGCVVPEWWWWWWRRLSEGWMEKGRGSGRRWKRRDENN